MTEPTRTERGFALMERRKQREIASQGGKAAHAKGKAHKWTSEEASLAGRKGGLQSAITRRARKAAKAQAAALAEESQP